jgi:hypothetical protein
MARPRLPDHRLRNYRLQTRLSASERGSIERAAEEDGQPVGEWVREVALMVVRKYLPECEQDVGRGPRGRPNVG